MFLYLYFDFVQSDAVRDTVPMLREMDVMPVLMEPTKIRPTRRTVPCVVPDTVPTR